MNTTDRELLELAAKAAGYKVRWHDRWECFVHGEPHNINNPPTLAGQRQVWVPLDDDGDALRLAVKLRMSIEPSAGHCAVAFDDRNGDVGLIEQGDGEDGCMTDLEIVRRSIVRAAAEIGRAMP
jgi:hypothetical protein